MVTTRGCGYVLVTLHREREDALPISQPVVSNYWRQQSKTRPFKQIKLSVNIFILGTDLISLLILLLLLFFFLFFLGWPSSKNAQSAVVSNHTTKKFDGIVPEVNVHWLTESGFWYDVLPSRWLPECYFMQKSAATWWVHMKHLPGAYAAASSSSWYIIEKYFQCATIP